VSRHQQADPRAAPQRPAALNAVDEAHAVALKDHEVRGLLAPRHDLAQAPVDDGAQVGPGGGSGDAGQRRSRQVDVTAVLHGELVLAQRRQQPVRGRRGDAKGASGLCHPQLAPLAEHPQQREDVVRRGDGISRCISHNRILLTEDSSCRDRLLRMSRQ
jgi:hypothetical protein